MPLPGESITDYVARVAATIPDRREGEPMGDWRIRAVREHFGVSLAEAVEIVREACS